MNLLADIIYIVHIIVVLLILSPFVTNDIEILKLSFISISYVIFKWTIKNDMCALTLLEHKVRGIEVEHGFVYQLLSPIMNVEESVFYKNAYYLTLLSLIFSIYKLFYVYKIKLIDFIRIK